jgi:hypothetical protein
MGGKPPLYNIIYNKVMAMEVQDTVWEVLDQEVAHQVGGDKAGTNEKLHGEPTMVVDKLNGEVMDNNRVGNNINGK